MLTLYNSKTRKKEPFTPLKEEVRLYTCGPTVYDFAHIGNLRTYIFEDVLKRVLFYNEYEVKHVMNITDVGHLVSDDDTGEDKVEKKAKEEKKDAWQLTSFYTGEFINDAKRLNILGPTILVKATDTIKEQIDLVKILEEKGYTYIIEDGVYFDTSKLDDYGKMANLDQREAGKRVEMRGKKNPTDFALWKFSKPEEKRQMEWEAPWGKGFPGWHTECVVMSAKYLGIPFDIHCGGIDHIEIHHPNEIAQAKAAYGENPANFWMHGEFLTVKEEKMSKSKGNFYTLKDIKKDYPPLAYRYLCLNSHYRSKMNFSREAMQGAKNSLRALQNRFDDLEQGSGMVSDEYKKEFLEAVNNDLNTPRALDITWSMLKDNQISDQDKRTTLEDFDRVLGLRISETREVPQEVTDLAAKRDLLRRESKFDEADEIREQIEGFGYRVEDIKDGYKITKK